MYTTSSPFTELYFGKFSNAYFQLFAFDESAFELFNSYLYGLFVSFTSLLVNTNVTELGRFPAELLLSSHTFVTGIDILSSGTSNLFVIVYPEVISPLITLFALV